ncbi:MAG: DNA recombination protein RmuC [Candidatus Peribacteraceae bacterium]|nr:DNA recombination protein RmuC [Candidatus Peribacteraceae bacterium]
MNFLFGAIGIVIGFIAGGAAAFFWVRSIYEQQLNNIRLTEEKLNNSFTTVASSVLEKHTKQFEQSAQKDLKQITTEAEGQIALHKQAITSAVDDLKKQLTDANKKIEEFEKDRTDKYAKLDGKLDGISSREDKLILVTQHLKSALTTSESVRGKWGELVLRNIFKLSGLTEGKDFTIQQSTTTEEGNRLRPDCIIRLPNSDKCLLIDAKASLYESYEAADEAKTEEERQKLHKEFAAKLRGRIKDLSKREYQEKIPDSVPYVVLFVPSEAAMRAALEADHKLLEDCASSRIILSSPATLMALVLLVADAWRHHNTATKAVALVQEVKDLGNRLVLFVDRLAGVQKGMDFAAKHWNLAVSTSWTGQKGVIRSLDKIARGWPRRFLLLDFLPCASSGASSQQNRRRIS